MLIASRMPYFRSCGELLSLRSKPSLLMLLTHGMGNTLPPRRMCSRKSAKSCMILARGSK